MENKLKVMDNRQKIEEKFTLETEVKFLLEKKENIYIENSRLKLQDSETLNLNNKSISITKESNNISTKKNYMRNIFSSIFSLSLFTDKNKLAKYLNIKETIVNIKNKMISFRNNIIYLIIYYIFNNSNNNFFNKKSIIK